MIYRPSNKGYTLIELSMVITIVGLLIAAVAIGSSLVAQARLKAVITESSNYFNAIGLFEAKYKALPGDITNASDIWGTSCSSTPTLCNGNGDGHITWNNTSLTQVESFRAWQHLSLSSMVNGNYSGIATIIGQADAGANVPASNLNKGGWGLNYNTTYAPPNGEGQYLELGLLIANNQASNPIMNPLDAYSIDAKIDDGYPRNGLLYGYTSSPSATSCYTTTSTTATYNTNLTTNMCGLRFVYRKY